MALYSLDTRAERALLIANPDDGRVIVARNANRPSFPASLTKLMTSYLLLDAVAGGRYRFTDTVKVSATAAATLPRKLGLRVGSSLTIEQVLLSMIVYSANDAAVVAAEALAGSEHRFATMMNRKARELGMTRSYFRNASGLPDSRQITTARDMLILARALQRDFRQYYHYFSQQAFALGRRHVGTHNNFVVTYQGADGLKTGFTCHAGYNLVASARRGSRRLIGVVLGESDRVTRDARMKRAMDSAFAAPEGSYEDLDLDSLPRAAGQGGADRANRDFIANSCINPGIAPRQEVDVHQASEWTLEFGLDVEKDDALAITRTFMKRHAERLADGRALLIPRWVGTLIYRTAVTNLAQTDATGLCRVLRRKQRFCLVLSPEASEHALTHAMRTIELVAAQGRAAQSALNK